MAVSKFNQLPDELIKVVMGYWSPRDAQKLVSLEWRNKMGRLATKIRREHKNHFGDQDLDDMRSKNDEYIHNYMYKIRRMYSIHPPKNNIIKSISITSKNNFIITFKSNILQGETKKILDIVEYSDLLLDELFPPETLKKMIEEKKAIIKRYEAFQRTNELIQELIIEPYTQNIERLIVCSRNFWEPYCHIKMG